MGTHGLMARFRHGRYLCTHICLQAPRRGGRTQPPASCWRALVLSRPTVRAAPRHDDHDRCSHPSMHPPIYRSVSISACERMHVSLGTRGIFAPDHGGPVIVALPPGAGAGLDSRTASPRCLLRTDAAVGNLPARLLKTYTAAAALRFAVLCEVPALFDASFPGGGGSVPTWAKLWVKLDEPGSGAAQYPAPYPNASTLGYPDEGLAVWSFGLSASPVPSLTWAAGVCVCVCACVRACVPVYLCAYVWM